jgi:hypothetical protein
MHVLAVLNDLRLGLTPVLVFGKIVEIVETEKYFVRLLSIVRTIIYLST